MIVLTVLNHTEITINADYIEVITQTPDTTITLTTGRKVTVQESVDDIIDKIIEYKNRISK